MKKIFRIFILIFTFQLLNALFSCCNETKVYRFSGIELCLLDNSGETPIVTLSDSLSSRCLGIRIKLLSESEKLSFLSGKMNLLASANALTCNPEYVMNTDIQSLQIYSSKPIFDSIGSDKPLNGYFMARYSEEMYEAPKEFSYILEQLSHSSEHFDVEGKSEIDCFLIQPVSAINNIYFIVEMTLSNGQKFIEATENVCLY